MRPITPEFLDELIDFAPSGPDRDKAFWSQQREGTVASFNMLARNRCAYLADEVGMGKTYIALGVMSLLRYFNPHARIIVIAPRENIQRKWVKELHNFVEHNWRVVGNRVKSLKGGPVWEPVVCNSLVEFAHEALLNQDRDFFLRMTSFSIRLSDSEDREKTRSALLDAVPWLERCHVPNDSPEEFRDAFAVALNGAIPQADLVIFDEAHNLKHGFRADGSTRNRVMGLALGHRDSELREQPWYMKKAKRVLLLSATPFDDDYASIQRQLEVFGFGDVELEGENGECGISVATLANDEVPEYEKRDVVKRLLIRRVSGLKIAGQLHTKNMYRREWRRGGLERHDEAIEIADPRQRLIVALMQKKVAEILQTERFNNHFQIGMLSSFESFLQSVKTARCGNADEPEFDGEEQRRGLSDRERNGIDTVAIDEVVRSYRQKFGNTLPHPKLDTTADALSGAFKTGEKALVFVRRVGTVNELAAKLDESFDAWIRDRMETRLPKLHDEIAALFECYASERLRRPDEINGGSYEDADVSREQERIDRRDDLEEEDEGGAESFFSWFFRGNGPPELLSGAAFRKNRLSSTSSVYATLFEDDYVANLLGVQAGEVLESLARLIDEPLEYCNERMRRLAFGFFHERSRQSDGYPRLYVFEGYQVAGMTLLCKCDGEIGKRARVVLKERFGDVPLSDLEPPAGFPEPDAVLGTTTVFTEIRRHPVLRKSLWPEEKVNGSEDFRTSFRRLEQRRELLSAMARLGASYIDLYLLAIARIGSFKLGQRREAESAARLAVDFVALLEGQMDERGFHAFQELSQAAEAFDHIMSVNFPKAPSCPLPELARLYGITLQKQVPVGRMSGSVNQRLVRQFRMPGFPLVLVTTDVLQEGEDLHTFCRRVVHYGIAWTPSAIEQRTGRVDRIGGLVQRRLDGSPAAPKADDLIQVYYPYLQDTVELLQVRRVLRRLNRFLRLIHRGDSTVGPEVHAIETGRAMLDEFADIPPIEGKLKSAFPIALGWLEGELGAEDVSPPDWKRQYHHLEVLWEELCKHYPIIKQEVDAEHLRRGKLSSEVTGLTGTGEENATVCSRIQPFMLGLRSQVAGDEILIECESLVGFVDMQDDAVVGTLMDALAGDGAVKLCVEPRVGKHHDRIYIRRELLFDPDTTEIADIRAMFESSASPAIRLRGILDDAGLFGTSGD
ncbi:MAG: DEAD/DEAH box helicase family protein [Gammaproteobacteria bacterium]|nr:DEAD/DEAH box helicase family protein [Gammaproteobacteria bacterium]